MIPVSFDNCAGWYHPASGPRAVLLCSAHGYEELCTHRGWRVLAENLAKAGLPTLRFDYHGTGDSTGDEVEPNRLSAWLDSTRSALTWLRQRDGVHEVALVGLRLGAALAAVTCEADGEIDAMVLMAPVVSGRTYVREMMIMSRMLLESAPGRPDPVDLDSEGIRVGGFLLNRMTLQELPRLNLNTLKRTAKRVLVLAPPQSDLNGLVKGLQALGSEVEMESFKEYDWFNCGPIESRPPYGDFAVVQRWLTENLPSERVGTISLGRAQAILGRGWRESSVKFGTANELFGILCEPTKDTFGPPIIIFVTGGFNRHIGWGRLTVEAARTLAEHGIASLRMDIRGVGESGEGFTDPRKLLYAEAREDDVIAAIDYLFVRGFTKAVVVGACSGAYLAFHVARRDARVASAVLINLRTFVFDHSIPFDDEISLLSAPMGSYIKKGSVWRRLLGGELALSGAWRRSRKHLVRVVGRLLPEPLSTIGRADRSLRQSISMILQRGTKLAFVYSESDYGLGQFRRHIASHFSNKIGDSVILSILEKTDHDLSDERSREEFKLFLLNFVCPEPSLNVERVEQSDRLSLLRAPGF
jgi:pimeloyl-ACP methyl ester carboxylesterase